MAAAASTFTSTTPTGPRRSPTSKSRAPSRPTTTPRAASRSTTPAVRVRSTAFRSVRTPATLSRCRVTPWPACSFSATSKMWPPRPLSPWVVRPGRSPAPPCSASTRMASYRHRLSASPAARSPTTRTPSRPLRWRHPCPPRRPDTLSAPNAPSIVGVTINGKAVNGASLSDSFVIEDLVIHGVDVPHAGLLRWNANQVYVTPTVTQSPVTTAPRSSAASTRLRAETVNVAAGTYDVSAGLTIGKQLTIDARQCRHRLERDRALGRVDPQRAEQPDSGHFHDQHQQCCGHRRLHHQRIEVHRWPTQ